MATTPTYGSFSFVSATVTATASTVEKIATGFVEGTLSVAFEGYSVLAGVIAVVRTAIAQFFAWATPHPVEPIPAIVDVITPFHPSAAQVKSFEARRLARQPSSFVERSPSAALAA